MGFREISGGDWTGSGNPVRHFAQVFFPPSINFVVRQREHLRGAAIPATRTRRTKAKTDAQVTIMGLIILVKLYFDLT